MGATRILGLVGGTGPESTVAYYRELVAAWRAVRTDDTFPRILLYSIDGGSLWRLLEAADLGAVSEELTDAVTRLQAAGAGMALITSNSLHAVFDDVRASISVPMLSIVDATVEAVQRAGVERPVLLGTRAVMRSNLYPVPLFEAGISLVLPSEEEQTYIHQKYVDELIFGRPTDETSRNLIDIIGAVRHRQRADGIILAGTELSMVLGQAEYHGMPVIDSTRAHVDAAVTWLLGG